MVATMARRTMTKTTCMFLRVVFGEYSLSFFSQVVSTIQMDGVCGGSGIVMDLFFFFLKCAALVRGLGATTITILESISSHIELTLTTSLVRILLTKLV